jgi:chloramphenicol-sensitive protein RarD
VLTDSAQYVTRGYYTRLILDTMNFGRLRSQSIHREVDGASRSASTYAVHVAHAEVVAAGESAHAADTRRGLGAGVAAYLIWGAFPLYFPLLKPAGALEILAHRMLWSLVFLVAVVAGTHRWASVRAVFAQRDKRRLLSCAAIMIAANWGIYIWAVNAGHVVEASLGYFINPLFTIVLAVTVLHERLRPVQWVAVGIGALSIIVLTVDYGRPPFIALALAASFGLYGFLKKKASVGAIESLTIETGVLALPALATLIVLQVDGHLVFAHHSVGNSALLIATGAVTAIPLLLFGVAARLLPLSTMGLLQYMTPVLQLIVGVWVDHEAMEPARWAGFALVWIALIVLTVDGLRVSSTASRVSRSAG